MNDLTPPMLSLKDLHIGYSGATRNKNGSIYGPVNIEVQGPEMIGLIGKNGIGKSTLLRTLAGIQSPVAGRICFAGMESKKISRSDMAKRISYVSTESVHIPNLRVSELVALGRFPYTNWFGKLTERDLHIVRKAIESTGIPLLMNKPVLELSDGEKQKVMIARALAQDTPIIILDEPTAFLDLPARHEILRLLNDLARHNEKLIVFSTHDLAIAMDEVDKLWLMTDEGLIQGSPEDLVINHGFRKLFENPEMKFDTLSMSFKFDHQIHGNIAIHGEDPLRIVTGKAMERIGFRVTSDDGADYIISIIVKDRRPEWQITGNDRQSFNSIYDLAAFIIHNQ